MESNWRIWDKEKNYGDLFYQRATGELPEMESSKALAKLVSEYVTDNDKILDIGCGAGHYLRSLDHEIGIKFRYEGIDQTKYYIEKAKEAFSLGLNKNQNRLATKFSVGDIYNIPNDNNDSEIVICNNVLLHLPSIVKPLSELLRVSKKLVIIRTLIGDSSFRIKQVEQPEIYNSEGEPENFHYYNIYSEGYLKSLLEEMDVDSYKIVEDFDYDPKALGDSTNYVDKRPDDLSTTINGIQVNVYVLQPWKFLIINI